MGPVANTTWENVLDVSHLAQRLEHGLVAAGDVDWPRLATLSLCEYHACNTRWDLGPLAVGKGIRPDWTIIEGAAPEDPAVLSSVLSSGKEAE